MYTRASFLFFIVLLVAGPAFSAGMEGENAIEVTQLAVSPYYVRNTLDNQLNAGGYVFRDETVFLTVGVTEHVLNNVVKLVPEALFAAGDPVYAGDSGAVKITAKVRASSKHANIVLGVLNGVLTPYTTDGVDGTLGMVNFQSAASFKEWRTLELTIPAIGEYITPFLQVANTSPVAGVDVVVEVKDLMIIHQTTPQPTPTPTPPATNFVRGADITYHESGMVEWYHPEESFPAVVDSSWAFYLGDFYDWDPEKFVRMDRKDGVISTVLPTSKDGAKYFNIVAVRAPGNFNGLQFPKWNNLKIPDRDLAWTSQDGYLPMTASVISGTRVPNPDRTSFQ